MIYKRLLTYLKPHTNRFISALLCMGIFSGLNGANMWLIKMIFDKILYSKDLRMLYMITLLVPLVFAIKGIAGFGLNYLMYYITQNIIRKIRSELHGKLITLSHDFYARNSSAKLMARATNDVHALENALFRVPPSIIKDGLTVIIMICVLFYLHWKFALLSLVIFPIASLPLAQFGKKMRNASRHGQHQMGEVYAALQEMLGGISIIKAFMQENTEIKRFARENDKYYDFQHKFIRVDARSSPIMELIGAVAVSFVLWFGAKDVISGVWTAGSFVAFMTAAFSIYQPLKNFSQTNSLIQLALSGSERIFEVLDESPTIKNAPDAKLLPRFSKEIVYENVCFHYPEKRNILTDINLKIKAGEIIAIVGPSGSGKSTLASLLLRFYDPQTGTIKIDGLDTNNVTLESLRSQIGIVTQEVLLFNDTVRYNVSYGKPDATQDELIAAAKVANAHNFISQLPNGYDTIVGERGIRLSGGERQRLAIARAILKNPPILVLDEATSALDAESEKLVQEAIEHLMQNRTVLLIAHRLATVKKADRIVVIDKGFIIEEGIHDQLLKSDEGLYKKLHNLQLL